MHDACAPMLAEAVGDCYCSLGYAWDGTACAHLGGCECQGLDCNKLAETQEECESEHLGCVESGLHCGNTALYAEVHGACAAMDAQAAGDEFGHCLCLLGYAWNGTECVSLADCQCIGDDCDKLTETIEACQAAHAECS
jgi:hypothetical protein